MPIREGLLVVVSGPAGSGKNTLADRLIAENPVSARRAVTATTRAPRPGETHEKDYYFLSREEFTAMIAAGEFLEYTEFNGNLYGTPRHSLESELAKGGVVMLVIDVDGAESVKFFFPTAIFIFIVPPTPEELRRRLERRGTESRTDIENRLRIATGEMQRMSEYNFLIINDDVETATRDLAAVIRVVERALIFGGEMESWREGRFADWSADTCPF